MQPIRTLLVSDYWLLQVLYYLSVGLSYPILSLAPLKGLS